MGFLQKSSTLVKLATMVTFFLISFSLYGLYCYNTVSEVKINGPFYKRIIQGKDVIADILPPPQYLIETYLTAYQMLDDADIANLPGYAAKIADLKFQYLAQHAIWEKELPDDELKSNLVKESFAPATRMIDTLVLAFIPALSAGDKPTAFRLLHGPITADYNLHRTSIDKVVALAMERNQVDEARAAVSVKSRTYGQIALGISLFVLLSSLSWYLVNQIEAGLKPTA